MIHAELLADAADAISAAGHGSRNAVAGEKALQLGISTQTLYRHLRKTGLYHTGRKRRSDCNVIRSGLTDADILKVSALMLTSKRNQGRIIMPAEVAIDIAEANGIIPAGSLTPDALNRHLRRIQADKRSLLAAEPFQHLRSLHPNHVHQIDYSVAVQWYLDKKGLGERDMVREVYKNKPDNMAEAVKKGKPKLIRCALTDHFTGLIHLKYYYEPGESARIAIDFLIDAWLEKGDGNPFHGAPFILMGDKTSAHRNAAFANFMEALDVRFLDHKAGRSNVNGQVECAHRLIEQRIESRLRISPAKTLDQLNELAAIECLKYNATKIHGRHKNTRAGLWQTIRPEHLRVLQATPKQLKGLANKKWREVPVRGDYSIRFDGSSYRLAEVPGICPGMRVQARLNVFSDSDIQIRLHEDEPWIEVGRAQTLPPMQGGFVVDAAVIGEEFKSVHQTPAMGNEREMARMAYDADTDNAAENARKRRDKPFAGVDAFKAGKEFTPPSFMRRPGTDLPIAAAAEPAPMSLVRAMRLISSRLGRAITPEENQQIRARHPDGMTDADIQAWLAGDRKPALRAVS